MDAGVSEVDMPLTLNGSHISNPSENEGSIRSRRMRKAPTQNNVFDRTIDNDEALVIEASAYLTDDVRVLLKKSLEGFYFFKDIAGESQEKFNLLLSAMKREEVKENTILIAEGESGNKLYIVESGELRVTINGDFIRTMASGSMLGDLALLYDAPRSATVRCTSDCILWSLHRTIFKRIQAISTSEIDLQKKKWLIQSPELAVLPEIQLSRLSAIVKTKNYEVNDRIYHIGELTSQVTIIQEGSASVYVQSDISSMPLDEIDKMIGIHRPRERPRDSNIAVGRKSEHGYLAAELYQGCIIGIATLLGKAKLNSVWIWVDAVSGKTAGACSPVTVVSSTKTETLTFTVEMFENLFGSVVDVLGKGVSTNVLAPALKEKIFDVSKFKMKCILGSGSFGVVIAAEYREGDEVQLYALKALSKLSIIETGQLRHALDERKLLATMNSPFVLKLFGTYQTPHQVIMVTEQLIYGDLWSVIYEVSPYAEQEGLSLPLATFYCANLTLGLSHIHDHGVVFRDLKPENILLAANGYLRIIDFGFAKKVPYAKIDANGISKIYAKTYTLCGTPEYLAPEIIFNLGHDQSADVWALGVIFHEMLMGHTPFAPQGSDNVTELFTNIAMVKKVGFNLSPRFSQMVNDPLAHSLIIELLQGEPSERIGRKEGKTSFILEHSLFADYKAEELYKLSIVPEYIPKPMTSFTDIKNLVPVKPFKGDDKLFDGF